ncbi:MAG: DUF4397 domain-containing protein [Pseudomonadota bacterium]
MPQTMLHRSRLPLLGIAAIVGLAACDNDNDSAPVINLPPATAEVRVIHASPDAPAVNVSLNGTVAISDLDYGESSGYATVDAADYDIVVEGIIPGGNADVITVNAFPLPRNARATVLAVGDVANIAALPVDESATTPTSTQVSVAVVHAAPAAPTVDIFVTDPAADITGMMPTATLSFEESADAGSLSAGPVRIRATAGGNVVYDTGTVDLASFAGNRLFIAAIATTTATEQAASPIKLLVATDTDAVTLLDAGTQVGAKVVHASPDAGTAAGGPVEVFATSAALGADPVELIDAFAYTDIVPAADTYVAVPAGDYVFDVAPNTDTIGDSVFTSGSLTLGAGQDFTVIAAGRVAATPAFTLLVAADDNRPVATEARVKVIHAAPAAGTVDVYVTPAGTLSVADAENGNAMPLLDDFEFGTVTPEPVAVAPGDYDIRVVAGGSAAINIEGFTLAAGTAANVIARGPLEPAGAPTDFSVIVTTN